jgi:peptide-methionine (S)-S-oxide reductase
MTFARSLSLSLRAGAAVALSLGLLAFTPGPTLAEGQRVPPPAQQAAMAAPGKQTVVLAGGCFWGVQGVFEHVRGVESAVSGYAGGSADTANYHTVSSGSTGHAEAVRITYDPAQISLGKILQIFFSVATDPTEVNRQGPDVGTQYRSEIFATTPEQQAAARAYIAQLDGAHVFHKPIATKVEPLAGFYAAEEYHQDYLVRHPYEPYVIMNDLPKVQQLKVLFPESYREQPVLVSRDRA